MDLARRLFGLSDAVAARDISEAQSQDEAVNLARMMAGQISGKIGDALADPKVVLPWLMGAVGAPAFLIPMIVPIRDALPMAPQLLVAALLRRCALRKWFWVWGCVVEGLAVLAMAAVAAGLTGAAAGWAIIAMVAAFSLARGVVSVASKDLTGKVVARGRRGRLGGYTSAVAGLVGAAAGLYLALAPEAARPGWLLYLMLALAGLAWFVSALALAAVREHPASTARDEGLARVFQTQFRLIGEDAELRRFLIARALMTATALSGPIYVALAFRASGGHLADLGWLMLASGFAGAASSAVWGMLSDRSSRTTMALGSGIAGVLGVVLLGLLSFWPAAMQGVAPYGVALLVLGVGHAGVRNGRQTQILDIAPGDAKSAYVAVGNTVIGVLILAVGAIVGGLAAFSLEAALLALSLAALAGAAVAFGLRNAQRDDRAARG